MAITVTALELTPVKGTRIREVPEIELGASGARGDRAFYVVDEDGALVNGKRHGPLHTVRSELDAAGETLTLRFADGSHVSGPVALGASVTTSFFRSPRPARAVDGPFSEALSEQLGTPLRLVSDGSAVDRGPEGAVSLVSRGSLERLAEQADDTPVDGRRFRMLIEVDGIGPHEEDGWVGREIGIGDAVRLRMRGHIGRCVTTTRHPETGVVDLPTLKLLGAYRQDGVPRTEEVCFGIHGAVLAGGRVRVGDPVTVLGG